MASISKPSKSLRRKTIPVPAGAGRILRVTLAPLCKPTPLHSTGARTVCSNGKLFQLNRLHRTGNQAMLYVCHGIVARVELLVLYGVDFGHCGIEKRVSRVDVVGHIQDNLLRNGLAIPLDD